MLKRAPDHLIARTGVFHEWEEVGWKYVNHLIKYCGLNEKSDVADIGCGTGRMELMFREKWGEKRTGHYYGMECDKEQTDWMEKEIPNASIIYANLYNARYNPNGKLNVLDYKFPIEDESVDTVVMLSVFTHMIEPEVRAYVKEIYRMLRKGGKALITCFIDKDEGNESMKKYSKETFEDMMKPLSVVEFVKGDWSRGLSVHYDQDFYILQK